VRYSINLNRPHLLESQSTEFRSGTVSGARLDKIPQIKPLAQSAHERGGKIAVDGDGIHDRFQ
jgi:hypothetical protein